MKNNSEEKLEKMLEELHKGVQGREEWLTEDETATYDRIVSQRRWLRWAKQWSMAAALAGVFFLLGMLWPRQHINEQHQMAQTENIETPPQTTNSKNMLAQAPEVVQEKTPTSETTKPTTRTEATQKPESKPKAPSVSTEKDLNERLACIEKELDQVDEEVYTAHLKRIVAMDEKLQHMVKQILTDANGENTMAENTEEVIYF